MSSAAYHQGLLDEKEISENDKRCSGNTWCLFGCIVVSLMLVMVMHRPTVPGGGVPFSQELVTKGQIPRMNFQGSVQ